MKKYLAILVLAIASIFCFNQIKIQAYSADYLPGGKNYISADNFSVSETTYSSIDPFLVKPYTNYTLSMPRDYVDYERPLVLISFYENIIVDYEDSYDELSFLYNDDLEVYYINFTTNSNINYLKIYFDNDEDYITTNGMMYFQLEEGTAPTIYEGYIEGDLIDTNAPYFQNEGNIISYYDSPIAVSEIKSAMVAYDAIDGDLSNSITIVSDDYTSHNNVLGSYPVVFEVQDSSNNSAQVTVTVQVVDILKPIFSNIGTIQAVYPNTYSVENILNMLSASDNYDGDISSSIVLETDNYTANSNVTGTYDMEFSVSDASGNIAYYTQQIEVVDNEGPIISGVLTVVAGYDTLITSDAIKDNLNVTDNYDDSELLSFNLESDNYTSNHNVLGTYSMVFSVTDSNGNKTSKTISISVVDIVSPVVYFNSSIIQVYNDTVMALPDFVNLLSKANEIDSTENYYITVQYDSYTNHASTPGRYHLLLDIKDDKGETNTKQLEIRVVEKPIDYVYTGVVPDADNEISWLKKYQNYLIGGSISIIAIASNAIWFVLFKKGVKNH